MTTKSADILDNPAAVSIIIVFVLTVAVCKTVETVFGSFDDERPPYHNQNLRLRSAFTSAFFWLIVAILYVKLQTL